MRVTATRNALLIGSATVCLYSVGTRLFPDVLGLYTTARTQGRLFNPLGYWNAQGVLASLAIILAASVAIGRGRIAARAIAAAIIPLLALDCYFTLSRGAVAAVLIGIVAWLVVDPRRIRTSAWLLLLAPWSALAVLQARSMPKLVGRAFGLASAPDGHRLALVAVLMGIVGAAIVVVIASREDSIRVHRHIVTAYLGCGLVLVLLAFGAATARYGTPVDMAHKAYSAAVGPPPTVDNATRVESLSLNGRPALWRVAWASGTAHPVFGVGAGSFETTWLKNRPVPGDDRWAHSLYLQAFSEGGVVALGLLLLALAAPLVAVFGARKNPLIPPLFGVYVAYLVHAGTDWDWQVPALTLVALWAASAVCSAGNPTTAVRLSTPRVRWPLVTAAVICAVVAAAGFAGNWELDRSQSAANHGDYAEAVSTAKTAARWQPWSFRPWMALAAAERRQGETALARQAYRTAADRDPARWEPWFALAQTGPSAAANRLMFKQAIDRNPLSNQIAHYCRVRRITGCQRNYLR